MGWDGKVKAFLDRPVEGDWPYLWLDATCVKVRQSGRIVSVAVIVAVGVSSDGRRPPPPPGRVSFGDRIDGLLAIALRRLLAASPSGIASRADWPSMVADQLRPTLPKLAAPMDEAEADVLAYMAFPRDHRAKIRSTSPLERLNGEIKRRADVVGIFPGEDAATRPVGALLLEQSDERAVPRARYMTLETIAPLNESAPVSLPTLAA